MKRIALIVLLVLSLWGPGYAAYTNPESAIVWNSIKWQTKFGPLDKWLAETEAICDGSTGFTGSSLYVVPQSATPSPRLQRPSPPVRSDAPRADVPIRCWVP